MYRPQGSPDTALVVSATDLTGFLACEHLLTLEREAALGLRPKPERDDPELEILWRRGDEHEQAHLEHLRSDGRNVVEITPSAYTPAELVAAQGETFAAMQAGADVIYQATFFDGRWRGHADFLLRRERPSSLGEHSYEVADTKLARRVKAAALLQMCVYSEALGRLQGVEPASMHVVLGDGTTVSHPVADYSAYYRSVKRRFDEAIEDPERRTYPEKAEHCGVCRWADVCAARRGADDHLSLVARMRRDQAHKLAAAGVPTVAALAACPADVAVPGVSATSLASLRAQAALQVAGREQGRVLYELLEPVDDRGLAALPPPSPGDVFFDMEGDPWVGDAGIEYLFGVVTVESGEAAFTAFWAHDDAAEKQAFEDFVDFVTDRRERFPDLHVYHFAPYETSALKRLMGRHGTREAAIDRLLRARVFVDLYQVVRNSIRVSQASYGIKALEPLYMDKREGVIVDGAASIVSYERWLETVDTTYLADIGAYNELDCISTWKLRDWLEARRPDAEALFDVALDRPAAEAGDPSDAVAEEDERTAALVRNLTAGAPDDPDASDDEQGARRLLAHLLGWHRREAKPQWWEHFRRLGLSDDQLVEDADCIGGLAYEGEVGPDKQSLVHRYRFDPAQEYKVREGDQPVDPRTQGRAGRVVFLDSDSGELHLKRSRTSQAPHPGALIPATPIDDRSLRQAVARVGERVVDDGIDAEGPYRAARDLLLRRPPRLLDHTAGTALRRPGEDPQDAARRLALALDHTCLAVQGPPGSGKTYAGARTILDLVAAGRTVGVTALSHKAISNLLAEVSRQGAEGGAVPRILQKADGDDACDAPGVECVESPGDVEDALAARGADVVAGTAWLFARPGMAGAVDTLFVDEAGQLSLANVVAVSGASRSIVLLGDPQQLAQPSKGAHPPGAALSALAHLLGGHATIPPEQGLFLDRTYRMHPGVCAFVSERFYEGRLEPDDSCHHQTLGGDGPLSGTGLRFLPVPHTGNRAASPEEAAAVAGLVEGLLGAPWTDRHCDTRPLSREDILVVAPYNAQVVELERALGPGHRVGTVDRFQGQQAPVVIFSTASSSVEDAPRSLDFLFSLHRLNVAVSRAHGLAVLVASPDLLRVRCRRPAQMRRVNAVCRFEELARTVAQDPFVRM